MTPVFTETITRIEFNETNCYLIKVQDQFVLIDTGWTKHRKEIEAKLEEAGCERGNLKLILLTHGDFDHTGNCAYFKNKFDCSVAMHYDDLGMVQLGDFLWNRNVGTLTRILFRIVIFIMRMKLRKEDRFTPDIFLEDGQDISDLGIDAKVIYIPGHSKGSIGILTKGGDLFCGDLLVNTDVPEKNKMISDAESYDASITKVKPLGIQTVYPGHGESFTMKRFLEANQEVE